MESFVGTWPLRRFAREAGLALFVTAFALLCGLGPALGPAAATAAEAPPPLWRTCETGSAAGQCSSPRGVAADPRSGHVFVGDNFNSRIAEFNALGQFVRAWGWDVVEGGGSGFEICVPEDGDVCQAGTEGPGTGQFNGTHGIAVDSAGDVYVVDRNNSRVQKFDSEGHFLLMFGGQVNLTKVGEAAPEAERNLCPVEPADVCQAGTQGSGDGQFAEWPVGSFIAIDKKGTETAADDRVYVGDQERIQVFDAAGHYLEDLPEDPAGELKESTVQSLAVDATGNLYAVYSNKPDVRKLTPAGVELPSPRFKLPKVGFLEVEQTPTAIAVDAAGNVYAFGATVFEGQQLDPIYEFDPTGKQIANFGKGEFSASTGLATDLCPGDEAPDLYATNASGTEAFLQAYGPEPQNCGKALTGKASNVTETSATLNGRVNPEGLAVTQCSFEYGTDASYGETALCAESPGEIGEGTEPVAVHAAVGGLDKGTVYHFRLHVETASGAEAGVDSEFKTLGPPVISADHTVGATDTEATVKALVNPEGFPTTYKFEYGASAAYGKSTPLQSIGFPGDRSEHTASAVLGGLAPGHTYHWRIVAQNSSGAAPPGADHTLTTYRTFVAETGCPNQALRGGPSAFLPDCRAYEMVSPVDKNGGDIVSGLGTERDPGGYVQASPDGARITYTSLSTFGDEPSSVHFNQYLATREGTGWSSQGIHPPVEGGEADADQFSFHREFMAFTPNVCSAWLIDHVTPPPTADGQEGFANLYRRQNCEPGAGGLEALTPAPPPLPPSTPKGYIDQYSVQGISADGAQALFAAQAPLTPGAASGSGAQLYDRSGGGLALVSVLPGGVAASGSSEAGSGFHFNLEHAVSSEGSRVYWSNGRVYLREHPEQGIVSGECASAAKACTLEVSAGPAFFWDAAADGSKALYSEGDLENGEAELFEFDLEKAEEGEAARRLIASHVKGVAGASDDLGRVYFVSSEALAGSGQNSEGEEAQEGEPNLYLDEGGTQSFAATLSEKDIGEREPGALTVAYDVVAKQPYERPTRVSADGEQIAFESRAALTGFDNSDAGDGRADVEVFRYDATSGKLACVSCNPSGARPSGARELLEPYAHPWALTRPTTVSAAAWIPNWEHPLHASGALSADGARLFFNSNDALLPRDSNGAQDVYEWEAPGAGGCTKASASFQPSSGGCLYLISSGQSPFEAEFWEATPSGDDVFFNTASSLVPADPGLIDLYDARVGGGIAEAGAAAACEGEACQSPPPPPRFATPASAASPGPGNQPSPRRCAKGRHRVRHHGKSHCAKKHRRHRRAGHKRRAAR